METGKINNFKTRYDDAFGASAKLEVLKEALDDVLPNSEQVIDTILSWDFNFIDSWLKAFRWDELGRNNNQFIELLSVIKPNHEMLKSSDNFKKMYNVYANKLLDVNYLKANDTSGEIYRKLINDNRTYSFDESDFIELFDIFIDIKDNESIDDSQKNAGLRFIFLEDKNGNINGDLNTPAVVKQKLSTYNERHGNITTRKETNQQSNRTRELINDLMNNEEKLKSFVSQLTDDQIANFKQVLSGV